MFVISFDVYYSKPQSYLQTHVHLSLYVPGDIVVSILSFYSVLKGNSGFLNVDLCLFWSCTMILWICPSSFIRNKVIIEFSWSCRCVILVGDLSRCSKVYKRVIWSIQWLQYTLFFEFSGEVVIFRLCFFSRVIQNLHALTLVIRLPWSCSRVQHWCRYLPLNHFFLHYVSCHINA